MTRLESEQRLLGGLMARSAASKTVPVWRDPHDLNLTPSDFVHACHRGIWSSIEVLAYEGEPFDPERVAQTMEANEYKLTFVGGPEYLYQIATDATECGNLDYYADLIRRLPCSR